VIMVEVHVDQVVPVFPMKAGVICKRCALII
jgi:hypothetical protein